MDFINLDLCQQLKENKLLNQIKKYFLAKI